jgi:uncharacterized sporulation protein YeaH/YhbH (DUF444 family)
MATIIDRRKDNKKKSIVNRKKFIDRYRDVLAEQLNKSIASKSIKNIRKEGMQGSINKKELGEPSFSYDKEGGTKQNVATGNKYFRTGDRLFKPYADAKKKAGGKGGEGEDDFQFMLTKEEFLNLYFEDLELPNFIKENLKKQTKFVLKRAGYTREGVPARLNLKKSFENALARRIANKKSKKKLPWLDDIDLRYNYFDKFPKPVKKAAMFCLMDVSGSMMENEKMLAKKFYILLYLFLEKMYEEVDVIFIRYHSTAREVDEETFFKATDTGGTNTSTAFELANDIINSRYSGGDVNLYVAHASDGDNWMEDYPHLIRSLQRDILPRIQYLAYLQVSIQRSQEDLFTFYVGLKKRIKENYEKINYAVATISSEVFSALRELFKKGGLSE